MPRQDTMNSSQSLTCSSRTSQNKKKLKKCLRTRTKCNWRLSYHHKSTKNNSKKQWKVLILRQKLLLLTDYKLNWYNRGYRLTNRRKSARNLRSKELGNQSQYRYRLIKTWFEMHQKTDSSSIKRNNLVSRTMVGAKDVILVLRVLVRHKLTQQKL